MKVSGKFKKWCLAAVIALAFIATVSLWAGKEEQMTQDKEIDSYSNNRVPDEAVYLGTDMGGEFVILRRQDIRLETGKVLPAFRLEIYRAWSNGEDYGIERIGRLLYSGAGLYVPPQALIDDIGDAAYEPPSIDFILGEREGENNSGVSSDVFFIHLRHRSEERWREYIAHIVPLNVDLQ